jgi:Leucine-rich repeat (LRR) protein
LKAIKKLQIIGCGLGNDWFPEEFFQLENLDD